MKNITLTLLFTILACLDAHSQNILVEYENKNFYTTIEGKLIIDDTLSLYTFKPHQHSTIRDEEGRNFECFILKSERKGFSFQNNYSKPTKFKVKDSLHTMKWELNSNTKVILEEKCLSAITTFRGRKYTAYYATSLPYSNGPWKFGGLPGLILEIVSEDGNYYYKATKIVKNYKEKIDTQKIYSYDYVGWTEYTKEFIGHINKKMKETRASLPVNSTEKGFVKFEMIEIVYPKFQTGKGLEY
jgi:GLPGLI family protein